MVRIQDSMDDAKKQERIQAEKEASVTSALNRIKNKFIVMSGKGGVGKTSVSVNLSIALANKGFKVGLMDVDIHGPDIPRMLGLNGLLALDKTNKLKPMQFSENLHAVSIESLMPDKDNAIIWRGPVKHSAIQQFIGDVAWGDLDYLIIDAPPGTGDEPLTVAQMIKDAQAIIVTTPQEVALADVRKSLSFCKTVNMNVFGLVENMSGFECPHCSELIELFGKGGGEHTANISGVPFLGRIPFDLKMVLCGDAGKPYQDEFSDSGVSNAFADVADILSQRLSE